MSYRENQGARTALMFELASSRTLTIAQAVESLKRDAHMRTVPETIARYSGLGDMEDKASRRALVDMLVKGNPTAKRDSVERNVRTWMKPTTQVISRDNAIQLAYALGLDVPTGEEMMTRLCGESFHWRDPEDIVWIFGLKNGLQYHQAADLRGRLEAAGVMALPKEESDGEMTALVRQEVARLETEEDLEAFLRENRGRLGRMHNTAYGLFREFMGLLGLPQLDDGLPDVDAMSVREIITTYMYDSYIPRAQRSGKGAGKADDVREAIQRDIRQNWPEETVLSKMLHRQTDVTRKVLVLLFLACDGGESAYGDWTDETPDDIFQDMYARMNNMLLDCGFPPLDSRTPFDWMVLYCMCADESIFIEDYVRRFLTMMFAPAKAEGEQA